MSLANSERSFSVAPDESVLAGALAAGLNLPHGCLGGNCGACQARLLRGETHYPRGRPLGLSDADVSEGLILLCQARALTDLLIDTTQIRPADQIVVKRLPSRIQRAVRVAHDVLALHLRLPAAEPFAFEPGQYIDILLPQGRRRSFSIASPPHDAALIELHVRRVTGGAFTEPLFAGTPQNQLLNIEGPFGRFVYRHAPGVPLLLVGGGTGLAPLKSIMRHVIENAVEREIMLYWGVRTEGDLYAHRELEEVAIRTGHFSYVPVLSEPAASWTGRQGFVHEAVIADLPDLADRDIYTSGPPEMIAAARHDFLRCGASTDRLYFDSFDYAPDTLERQRTMAVTKS